MEKKLHTLPFNRNQWAVWLLLPVFLLAVMFRPLAAGSVYSAVNQAENQNHATAKGSKQKEVIQSGTHHEALVSVCSFYFAPDFFVVVNQYFSFAEQVKVAVKHGFLFTNTYLRNIFKAAILINAP